MNWPTSAGRLASVSLLGTTLLSLASGCDKTNDPVLDLPGTSPISASFLDLPVEAATVRQPVVQTVKGNSLLTGRLRDSFVGLTEASALLNLLVIPSLSPADSLPAKFTDVTLDSAVFRLPFDQVYGSAAQPLRFDLLPLQQPLDVRTVYNATTQVATGSALVTDFVAPLNREVKVRITPSNATDTVKVIGFEPDRTIRVPLLKSPGAVPLVNAVFTALKNEGFDQNTLDGIWKGVVLQPTAGHMANIVSFPRFASTAGRITFYFRGTNDKAETRSRRSYSIYPANIQAQGGSFSDGLFFTQLTTDFSAGTLAGLTPGSSLPASATNGLTYVQEGVGLATRLTFTGLDQLRNDPTLAVNRAELLIPVKQLSNGLLPYPQALYLYEVNSANEVLTRSAGATTADRLVQREGGVTLTSGAIRVNPTGVGFPTSAFIPFGQVPTQYYTVGITEYLQAYLQDRLGAELPAGLLLSPTLRNAVGLQAYKEDTGLISAVSNLNLNRAQLDASSIKLRVYYSKLQ